MTKPKSLPKNRDSKFIAMYNIWLELEGKQKADEWLVLHVGDLWQAVDTLRHKVAILKWQQNNLWQAVDTLRHEVDTLRHEVAILKSRLTKKGK